MAFRLLLVGLGNRGRQWADIVRGHGEAELAAVVDTDPARIAAFVAHQPGVPSFPSLAAALAGARPDAVLLVTPPTGRLDQARAIFAAGLPLLAEKPLAVDLEEAAAIVRLAEAHGLPLTIGLNFRYLAITQAIRDLVARRAFGVPGFAQFTYQRNRDGRQPRLNKYPLTMRHPMMLEQSIHHLDLIRFAYGREVAAVSCRTWNPPWSMYAHDANVSCLLTLADGMTVDYLGTWAGGWNELQFQWRTDCAEGVIVQQELFSGLATARTGDAALTPVALPECRAFVDDTRALLDAFIAAVRQGAAPPCSGRDHLRTLALCFAAIEAAKSGQRVALDAYCARAGLGDLQ
jgi:predicted dehydrogenase